MKKSKHDADDGGGNCNKAAQAKELIDSIESWDIGIGCGMTPKKPIELWSRNGIKIFQRIYH